MQSAPLILCVDDDAAVLTMTRRLLESAGYRVLSASSGREALRIPLATPLDAAVLDYSMPELDGPHVAAALRQRLPHLPIVFYTGSPERVTESRMNLADACVEKGTPISALLEVLRSLLERNRRRKFVRQSLVAPLGVRLHRPGSGSTLLGRSFDLCEGGLGGSLDGALVPGQVVSTIVQLPTGAQLLTPAARVAYRHGERHGFQFLALSPPERQLIREALATHS